MTVRNIRAHVTRGLLPPPYLRGRTGYYGPEHLARLNLITGLQQQGFNLAAIHTLVAGPSAPSAEETVAFYRTALGPWLTESPEVHEQDELAASFGITADDDLLRELEELGVLQRLEGGRLRVLNPAIIRVGRQLAGFGYDLGHLMSVLKVLLAHSRSVAGAFADMFLDVHWAAYVDAGMPAEQLPELRALIEQLQPLAAQAVVAGFQQAMTDVTGRAFGSETEAREDDSAVG